jgi:hypothetical protein
VKSSGYTLSDSIRLSDAAPFYEEMKCEMLVGFSSRGSDDVAVKARGMNY